MTETRYKTYECPKCHGEEFALVLTDGECLYYCGECKLYYRRRDLVRVNKIPPEKIKVYKDG